MIYSLTWLLYTICYISCTVIDLMCNYNIYIYVYIYIYYGEFCHMHHVRNVIYNIRYISYIVYYEKQL